MVGLHTEMRYNEARQEGGELLVIPLDLVYKDSIFYKQSLIKDSCIINREAITSDVSCGKI